MPESSATKMRPVEFAPSGRHLQKLGAFYYTFMMFFFPFLAMFLPIYIFFYTRYWWTLGLYALFYVYDYRTPTRGGRPSKFIQNAAVHKWLADYFPIKLIKTAELDSNHNYLLGYHPHGVISVGALTSFGTGGVGIFEKFPKLKFRLATLGGNFLYPLRREYMLSFGMIDVGKESLTHVLSSEEKGYAVALVIGGADEALEAHPDKATVLTLKERKGFVKLALETGAHLVPVYGFGENELYKQMENPEGSGLRIWQNFMKKITGVSPVIFHGRGLFNSAFGLLPFSSPMNVVVGKPIPVEKVKSPTDEQIDKLHTRYVNALTELFEANKKQYGVSNDNKLIIN